MADRIAEINTIGDLLTPVGASRFYKQNFPASYASNTIGIRWQGDNSSGLTAVHYTVDNTYQIVYFGSSQVDCLNKSEMISAIINDKLNMKTKIRDFDDYMTFKSFSMSAPFKTETDGIYAVSAILIVTTNRNRSTEVYEKMAVINADISINGGGN